MWEGKGAEARALHQRASMLHVYALCNLPGPSSPWPSPAASIRRTASPASPMTAGRWRRYSSTPVAPRPEDRAAIRRQAEAVGALRHHEVDARAAVFDRFVRYLIQGNVLRGEVYPLSVAAERTQQAISVIEAARAMGARAVAHGSTGAGQRPGALRRRVPRARAGARRSSRPSAKRTCSGPTRSRTWKRAACRCRPRRAPTASIAASGAPPTAAGGRTTPGPVRPTSSSSRRPMRRRRARS